MSGRSVRYKIVRANHLCCKALLTVKQFHLKVASCQKCFCLLAKITILFMISAGNAACYLPHSLEKHRKSTSSNSDNCVYQYTEIIQKCATSVLQNTFTCIISVII